MSFSEDIAKRYGDEIFRVAPISGVASFVIGVSLQASIAHGQSAWLVMLSKNYTYYWYFLDLMRGMSVGKLALLAFVSIISINFFRYSAKTLLAAGVRSQEGRLKKACLEARRLIGSNPTPDAVRLGYEKWYKESHGRILGIYRLGTLCLGVSLQTTLVLFTDGFGLDLFVAIATFLYAAWCVWHFSLEYYKAVLPKRIIIDSSLGLLGPDVIKGLDEIS